MSNLDALRQQLELYDKRGYHLNPDRAFTDSLLEGLLVNEGRYGYQACPCRLATGIKERDLDIVCPCDYRDPDLSEYDACYCGLYVSQALIDSGGAIRPIPERRQPREVRQKMAEKTNETTTLSGSGDSCPDLAYPVWRCDVCGYLAARDEAPEVCPICGAKKDRFSRFA
jgi:ferredoxin-thioredoxin reductase catalytic chain